MAENTLDHSAVHLSKENGKESETEENKEEEEPRKEITQEPIPEGVPLKKICIIDKSGNRKVVCIPYDKYFKMLSKIWNESEPETSEGITMEDKMNDAAPYNVFFTTLKYCPETGEQLYSIKFTDLLCPSLGKLKCSLLINFMVNIDWVLEQFASRKLHKLPMTIIYGYEGFPWPEKETMEELYPDIDYHFIEMKTEIGCHHTKLSIFIYEDGSLRVAIGSVNLFRDDWSIYNQLMWVSPLCPKLPEGCSAMAGESPTGFKCALLDYLSIYKVNNISTITEWIERVKHADFREVKVFLLYAVPGVHYPRKNGCFLHYLGHLLSRHCVIPVPKEEHDSWRVIAQTSALGLVGRHPDEWLTTYLLKSLASHKDHPYLTSFYSSSKTKFSLIFPTVRNCLNGYLGGMSAACCPYEKGVKEAQPWLIKYKCQWIADRTKRTRAMSHSKCYCRISPCWKKMAYFFLTSSNLSRSAWGKIPNRDSGVYMRSYEMGVLFLPKYFDEEYFEVQDSPDRKNKKVFPIMFDLPLTPYGPDDDSYCFEECVEKGLIKVDDSDSDESIEDDKNATENNDLKDTPVKLKEEQEGLAQTSATKVVKEEPCTSDESTNKDLQSVSNPKKEMKINNKPNNLFFPSFSK